MDNTQHHTPRIIWMDNLLFPVQKIATRDGPEVQLGRRLEQQLSGGGDALGRGADGPDAEPVEAWLQPSPQDKGSIGFLAGFRDHIGTLTASVCELAIWTTAS